MAAYLALKHKETGNVICGSGLIDLDAALCSYLDVPVDEVTYVHGWVDTIGFRLAMGQTFDQCREAYKTNPDRQRIITYLETNFENDSYHGR